MDWYYLADTHERIAISEAQLAPLAASGILRPATPVWRKGMGDWAACGEVKPEIFTEAVSGRGERNPAAEGGLVTGVVIGLARTLAGYNVWLRTLGVVLLITAVGTCVSLAVTTYYLITANDEAWKLILENLHWATVPKAAVWAVLAFQAVTLLLTGWAGFVLLLAAARAKRAAQSGSELMLTAALRETGRYFLTIVIAVILSLLFLGGLVLWLGWDVVRPSEKGPAEKSISI